MHLKMLPNIDKKNTHHLDKIGNYEINVLPKGLLHGCHYPFNHHFIPFFDEYGKCMHCDSAEGLELTCFQQIFHRK